MTLRERVEIVATWLHATYSRRGASGISGCWPGGWDVLSEKSKAKWRAEAGDLLGVLDADPDAERG